MSADEKKRLNFGRLATSKNSSSNTWLKTKTIRFLVEQETASTSHDAQHANLYF